MKSKQILVLFIAAVVLIGLAFWSGRARRPPTPALAGAPLVPELDLNAIEAVEVGADGKVLRLARLNDVWCVTNAFNYPADFARLSQRLIALRDIKIGQVQRGMAIEADSATRIQLLARDGKPLAGLVLGAGRQAKGDDGMPYSRGNDGRYLSRDGEKDVFLVKESLDEWNTEADGWLDTQIVSIPPGDVAKIELQGPGGETVVLDKSSGSLALAGLDAARETFESSKASGVDSALNYLRFSRIADPALGEAEMGFATGHLYRATLKSGEIYTARLGAVIDGDRYFKLGVEFVSASTNAAERAAAEKRVAETKARIDPWTFLIGSYAAGNMVRTRAELVSVKPPETNLVTQAESPAKETAPAAKAEPAPAKETAPAPVKPAPAPAKATVTPAKPAPAPAAKPAPVAKETPAPAAAQ